MTLNFVDVSSFQTGVDFSQIPNLDGVFVKATEGVGYVNPAANAQFNSAKALGKRLGFYHFAGSSSARKIYAPMDEWSFFYRNTQGYLGKGVPMLDFEPYGFEPADALAWVLTWVTAHHNATGVWPILYMSASRVAEWHRTNPARAAQLAKTCALFVAGGPTYNTAMTTFAAPAQAPAVPSYWTLFGWQYCSNGSMGGVSPLDLNVGYLDGAGWDAYAKGSPAPAKPAPHPAPAPHPSQSPQAAPVTARRYVVRKGDVLADIATRYGVSVATLVSVNHLQNANLIYPGEVLTIPSKTVNTYTVRTGDILANIASAHGTTWQRIALLNHITNPNLIHAGQVLRMK